MYGDAFHALQDWLRAPNSEPDAMVLADAAQRRLVQAYRQQTSGFAGSGDLATLMRSVLRREQEVQRSHDISLRLPPEWPGGNRLNLETKGLRVVHHDGNGVVVSADPWRPNWDAGIRAGGFDAAFFAAEMRRPNDCAPGDPILQLLGLESYRSTAQRTAVRAALTSPQGATLLVILPTGAGKSLCVQSLAVATPPGSGTVVVVVPTVALALDQERALNDRIPHPTAYYSGSTETDAERNRQIRHRIATGSQRVVFTSPEACLASLAPALSEAVEAGLLRCLAIDECHMVEQWGDGFRPAFQELAGLRRTLLSRSRQQLFSTLLMSATVAQSSVETLQTLFGDPGPFAVVASVQLRPEPEIWWIQCQDESTRDDRVLDALTHLPRPTILYVSTRVDSERWARRLHEEGWRRTRHLHGETPNSERQVLLRSWSAGDIDIMVATSAFGLGVDQAEVRSVIHACVPESVDRLYQEIGRGGRDGNASLALILTVPQDFEVARALSEDILISVEKGHARWKAMFAAKRVLCSGLYEVPLEARPDYAAGDPPNRYHTMWNVRTLNLMSRACLIRLEGRAQSAAEEDATSASVRVLDDEHLRIETWRSRVEALRQREYSSARQHLEWLSTLAGGQVCASHVFQELYRIELPGSGGEVLEVSRSCGGCAACRREGTPPYAGEPPEPGFPWAPECRLQEPLAGFVQPYSKVCLLYRGLGREHDRLLARLISFVLRQGVRNLVIAVETWRSIAGLIRVEPALLPFLHTSYEPLALPPLPTLVYVPSGSLFPEDLFGEPAAPLIIVAPEATVNPRKPWCPIKDVLKSYSLDAFSMEVGL